MYIPIHTFLTSNAREARLAEDWGSDGNGPASRRGFRGGLRPAGGRLAVAGVRITGFDLSLDEVVAVARRRVAPSLTAEAWDRVGRGRAVVERIVREGERVYGVTTGVGSQRAYDVTSQEVVDFNNQVLVAHATRAPGPAMAPEAVRAAIVVLVNQFATGANGVRPELVSLLLDSLEADRLPEVSSQGSVGASDLAPLAELAIGLMAAGGDGEPFRASAKEAVALMNTNALSLGYGALVLAQTRRLLLAFDLAAAMALEGFRGNLSPLRDAPVRSLEHAGRAGAAARIRALLKDSALWHPEAPRFIQDPLSFRCIATVHGTADRAFGHARDDWEREINLSNDNPMMDLDEGVAVSHGNMESSAETLVMDSLRLLLARLADMSGERQHKLHWPAFTGLPEGLARESGAIGGVEFLDLGHIAASFVAKVRMAAHPYFGTAVGQLCDGIEDTAGFAMQSVAQTEAALADAWTVATMEMIVASWAIARRDIAAADLGPGVRAAFEAIAPQLPIGREGLQQFDLRPIVAAVQDGGLLDEALSAAGLPEA